MKKKSQKGQFKYGFLCKGVEMEPKPYFPRFTSYAHFLRLSTLVVHIV